MTQTPIHTTRAQATDLKDRFLSGKYFADAAWQERINARRDSRPPTPYRYWANAVEVMGEMAGTGAVFAQIAAQIIKEIPLYQTDRELRAKVFETVGSVISEDTTTSRYWRDSVDRRSRANVTEPSRLKNVS